ncbi:MAG: hypothetical protein RMJ55_10095 [Roseiflexaceae bacterium]|nr:ester cyclase [Roseiflexus sp.]MDW8213899.1 hypothetical protein [Roseiflexaceae bacterium]
MSTKRAPLGLEGDHLQGVEAFKGLLSMFDAAFPHHRVSIEAALAEGDYVTVLHTHYKDDDASLLMQLGALPAPQGV